MIDQNFIQTLVEDHFGESEYFLVKLAVQPGNKIEVILDGDNGLPIDKCVEVSRLIESSLDREENDFELKVSSAGIDRPFAMARQYIKNKGRQVKFVLLNGDSGTGELTDADENGAVITQKSKQRIEGKKKKQVVEEVKRFSYDELKEVKVKLAF